MNGNPDWNWIAYLVLIGIVLIGMVIGAVAHGHEANQSDAVWFNSLQQPSGIHCCGEADCRAYDERSEVRINDGVYAILHNGEWLSVPEEKFIQRPDNPTGHFVACVHDIEDNAYVLCAVKGTGA